ncbi:hypothetical protein AMTR_s00095p00072860 [Amborella trichopoda]|uniref:Uncharacterized protein n=1 Tax=Amborella trichopoda TaxID=13333 RepID=W1NU20_AMBTC|nr:hypothetical protein AMTR_s00095p00072860 [Amborella trichopoda]
MRVVNAEVAQWQSIALPRQRLRVRSPFSAVLAYCVRARAYAAIVVARLRAFSFADLQEVVVGRRSNNKAAKPTVSSYRVRS